MLIDANLFWFGSVLEVGLMLIILKLFGSLPQPPSDSDRPEKYKQLTNAYLLLQHDLAQQQEQYGKERLELRQELQQQREQLVAENLQLKQHLIQQTAQLQEENLRLQQDLQQQRSQLTQENLALQQELHRQADQFIQERLKIQHEMEQQTVPSQVETQAIQALQQERDHLQQECLRLQQDLQQRQHSLSDDAKSSIFKKLQPLLVNYPGIHKIVQLKPDFPAKNLLALFVTLDNFLKDWQIEPIGTVWEQVPFDPQLHSADSSDIAAGEIVYIRQVGYRQADHILCPAKVSRTLAKAIGG